MTTSGKDTQLVIIDYEDLIASSSSSTTATTKNLMEACDRAFGADGIGLMGIRKVPGFVQAKAKVLGLAHPLAHLPENELHKLEDPDSMFNAGWSHGKEMLKAGKPDLAKGSFYFNPIIDVPDPKDTQEYPVSYPLNRWPKDSLAELEPACKCLGKLMKEVAVLLSQHIDQYAHSKNPEYPPDVIRNALQDTEKVKGRLLYYFPLPEAKEESSLAKEEEDSWIGWHNDSGFLTALAGDIYMDPNGKIITPPDDSQAGLQVVTRHGNVQKVEIPPDVMAIQIGECTQILTGGAVVATPHCVRGAPNLARASLACFVDVPPSVPLSLPKGSTPSSILSMESAKVPTLKGRWENGMTFGSFLQKTFEAYYKQ